ncbi:MAG: dual specificity protein phosphatase family protein [Planctomycetaceae bacterium]
MASAAVRTVSALIRENVSTLVYCSAGMSRSPSIVAAAIADVRGISLAEAIKLVTTDAPKDISPSLLADLQAAIGAPA